MPKNDYREYIRKYYELKNLSNSRYSMRALARDLGLSPSTLNEIINGHHTLSLRSSEKVLRNLKLQKEDENSFRASVSKELFNRKISNSFKQFAPVKISINPNDEELIKTEISEFISKLLKKYSTLNGKKNFQLTTVIYDLVVDSISAHNF